MTNSDYYGRFISSWRQTLHILQELRDEKDSDQTFLKDWANYLMCKVVGDQTNTAPRPAKPLFVGYVWSLVKRYLARGDASFFYSLLQAKRFWPSLGEVKEKAAISDAKDRLIRAPVRVVPEAVLAEISSCARRVFSKIGRSGTKFSPSPSACYQATVRQNGAYSLFEPMGEPSQHHRLVLGGLRSLNEEFEAWRARSYHAADLSVLDRFVLGDQTPKVEIQVIPEPSKFRIISKGDGFLYSFAQPLQGALLKSWKTCRWSTMEGDLDEKVRGLTSAPGQFWCSGDFKAATDTLCLDATSAVVAAVELLTESDLMRLLFLPSEVHFPDGEVGLQNGGQLMGHPLSFPTLCVINLALYWRTCKDYAVRKHDRSLFSLMRDRVLVNGDDILFKCDLEFYDLWKANVGLVGLIVSPGKNYLSRDYAVINSRLYYAPNKAQFRRLGYVNLKLIKGFSLKTGESQARPDQIGKDVSEMVRLCPQALTSIPAAFRRFKRSDWQPNWFLPVHLGGYGVDPLYMPDNSEITREQRRMASLFFTDPSVQLFRNLGTKVRSLMSRYSWFNNFSWSSDTEELEEIDDWIARLSQISFAMQGPSHSDPEWLLRRLNRSKLGKMSDRQILKAWNLRLLRPGLPACPPLRRLAF